MPKPTTEQAVADFAEAISLLARRVRTAAGPQTVSLSESSVLSRLEKYGPSTIAELARAEGVKPQSMGATVAGLEALALVQRHPHPTDGRQVHIALTPQGLTVRQQVRQAKHTWLVQALSVLDGDEQQLLFKAGDLMRRLAEDHTALGAITK